MTPLGRPTVVASLLVIAALAIHPAVRSAQWLPRRDAALAVLFLLVVAAFVARALAASGPRRLAAWLAAAGAALVVGALGADGIRGHRGSLDLVPGQARSHFDEVGLEGRSLGLRPLGFNVGLEGMAPGGGVELVLPERSRPVVLTPERAVGHGGFRLARPRATPTGSAARLRVGISGGGEDTAVELVPGRPTPAGELRLTLQEYYPDFALDDGQKPYTRSLEPRNPGAVLAVESPQGTFRAFVLRAMPGVHRVEQLDRSFALLAVEPEVKVELDVHREPLAGVALLGALVGLAALVLERRAG